MRYLTLGLLLAACFAVSGLAEESSPIGIGVKGGVPLNDAFVVREQNPVNYIADTHRYIVGPYVELRLPAGFGIELDALYQTYEYRQVIPAPVRDQNSHDWQFPLKSYPSPDKPATMPYRADCISGANAQSQERNGLKSGNQSAQR